MSAMIIKYVQLLVYLALLTFGAVTITYAQQQNEQVLIDVELDKYAAPSEQELEQLKSVAGVAGTLTSIGSDSLATLMSLWAQRFQELYPHVKTQIQSTGSSTASQALTQGTANIGPMSRKLSTNEISQFTRKHGYQPTVLTVAVDAIALYVERNNPLQSLSLQQIDSIYSNTRFCGGAKKIEYWTDVGVNKFGAQSAIILFGRNSASGTYDLFKQQALCDGDYKASTNELPGSGPIVLSVASSLGGIGYAALGYANTAVKALSLRVSTGNSEYDVVEPNVENITSGKYPFSRNLYLVVNKPPGRNLPLLESAFLHFILSSEGQKIVTDNGYYPVPEATVQRQLRDLAGSY